MKNKIIKLLLSIFRLIYKNKNYNKVDKIDSNLIKVNLGCGLNFLNTWINIDGSLTALFCSRIRVVSKLIYKISGSSEYYSFDEYYNKTSGGSLYWYDLSKRIPFKTESVDIIFSSHFLEHLSKKDGKNFIFETYRILKEGGLLRLVVPDLDIAIKQFNEGKINFTLNQFFYTADDYSFSAHKYNYSFETLKTLCIEAGFRDIDKKNYLVGNCPDISTLDIYPDHSLYLEAKK